MPGARSPRDKLLEPPCGGPRLAELRRLDAGEITGPERSRLLLHTDDCPHCQAALREFLADLASTYLIILGVVAIGVMLKAPKGIWGYAADRLGWQLFPLARHLVRGAAGKPDSQALGIAAARRSSAPSPT